MPPTDPYQQYQVKFYHFTDRLNLPLIRKLGGLHSLASLKKQGIVIPRPGGNEWSHDADGMSGVDTFVHLCLCNTHPMEWQARQEGRISDTIFLEIDASVRLLPGVRYTPDVSNKSGVVSIPLSQAAIDFESAYCRTDWSVPAIYARRQAVEKCEILIPNHVPMKYIRNMPNG